MIHGVQNIKSHISSYKNAKILGENYKLRENDYCIKTKLKKILKKLLHIPYILCSDLNCTQIFTRLQSGITLNWNWLLWRRWSICDPQRSILHNMMKIKGKAIPLQAFTCPQSSRSLRLPDLKKIGTWKGQVCQPNAPTAFTPRKYSWYSFLLTAESIPAP
jgi:hypothetical protein